MSTVVWFCSPPLAPDKAFASVTPATLIQPTLATSGSPPSA